jgi:hypothetical protein
MANPDCPKLGLSPAIQRHNILSEISYGNIRKMEHGTINLEARKKFTIARVALRF